MSQTIARAIETKRHWPVPPPPSFNVGQVHQNSTCWKSPTTLNEGGGAGGQDINTLVGSFFLPRTKTRLRKHSFLLPTRGFVSSQIEDEQA